MVERTSKRNRNQKNEEEKDEEEDVRHNLKNNIYIYSKCIIIIKWEIIIFFISELDRLD